MNTMVTDIIHHSDDLLEWIWAMEDELIPKPFFTSCYLLDGILIDTGAPGGIKDFQIFIQSILKEQPIKLCLITHSHEDHIGGAYHLMDELHIPVHASSKAIDLLRNASNYFYEEYRKVYWGDGLQSVHVLPFPSLILSNSEKYRLEIISTPGHAPDQVAFLERTQQWLFAADAVLPKYQLLFGGTCNIQENIAEIHNSIQNLYMVTEGMKDLSIFLSGRETRKGREFLKEKLREIEHLLRVVQDHKQDGLNSEEILIQVYGEESFMGIMTNGELSRLNLIESLMDWPIN